MENMETLIQKAKAYVRVRTNDAWVTEEIKDLVYACKQDLELAGVSVFHPEDPLIIRAVNLYCRANFGDMAGKEAYQRAYELLKNSLALAGDYKEGVSAPDT